MAEVDLLRIRRIEVKKLFNLHDHVINLKLDDHITILYGPNGVGKTVILSMVNALFLGRFGYFINIPFHEFNLVLTDERVISIKNNSKILHLSLKDGTGKKLFYEEITNIDVFMLSERIAEHLPWLTQIGEGRWFDDRQGDDIDAAELVRRYSSHAPVRQKELKLHKLEFFRELQEKVNIHLIETQRLLRVLPERNARYRRSPETMLVSTVTEYANDLFKRIKEAMAEYGQTSQKLDQSFPQRLLMHSDQISAEDLKKRMEELDAKRINLAEIGILDEAASNNSFNIERLDNLDGTQKNVMTLYVKDTHDKLQVLDNLASRIRIFIENLNKKFQNKIIKIDRQKGFITQGNDGQPLPLESLSSGEQHELVLHYDLLFRVRPNTLVLIDEPELSLHLSWQKRFLQDLVETVKVANFDALIATHSPFIIGDRDDLMVALDAEVGGSVQ